MLVGGSQKERRLRVLDELIFLMICMYSIVCKLYLPLVYTAIKYNSTYFSLIHISRFRMLRNASY